jgi:hypothetical protein
MVGLRPANDDRHCEKRERRSNLSFVRCDRWIASWSLSSGAHSRDPLARNDGDESITSPVVTRELCNISFIIFVDGMFTTFMGCPFTNTSHAIGRMRAISCV